MGTHSPAHSHRDIQGGAARAAVFGASDGLVSNVSLILGVAAAAPGPEFVRLSGLAGLVAGAVSMAFGEYISMRAQVELFEKELATEREALKHSPELELEELAGVYRERGLPDDEAKALATHMHRDFERALHIHAREELGVTPGEFGSPVSAAVSSFVAFAAGAFVPLVPWYFVNDATNATVVAGALGAMTIGGALSWFTSRPFWYSSLRQLLVTGLAAVVTVSIGTLLGG